MSKYIEQYTNAGSTTTADYFLISRNNVYYKLAQPDLYSELQALFGSAISLGSITDHTDVDTTGATTGDLFRYNGTNWVPSTNIGSINNASDVDTAGQVTGSLLRYNGTNYVPTAVANYFMNGGDTAGAERRLGNNDAFDLILETNNVGRVTILDTGEVGIGTEVDADIDDAQFFIRSSKNKHVIMYNTSSDPVLYYQSNDDATTRKNIAYISALFTDNTAGAEYGKLVFGVNKGDGTSAGSSLSGEYFLIDAEVTPDYVKVYTNDAKLHVYTVQQNSTESASDFKSFYVEDGSGGANPLFDIRSNGWILAENLPTSDTGLPVACFYVATAAQILANGDLVVGYKQ